MIFIRDKVRLHPGRIRKASLRDPQDYQTVITIRGDIAQAQKAVIAPAFALIQNDFFFLSKFHLYVENEIAIKDYIKTMLFIL